MILCPVCGGLPRYVSENNEMGIWMCPCRFSYLESDSQGRLAWTSCGPFRAIGLDLKSIPVTEERFRDFVRAGVVQHIIES